MRDTPFQAMATLLGTVTKLGVFTIGRIANTQRVLERLMRKVEKRDCPYPCQEQRKLSQRGCQRYLPVEVRHKIHGSNIDEACRGKAEDVRHGRLGGP